MIKNFEELASLQQELSASLAAKFNGTSGKRAVVFCGGTGCLSSDSAAIREKFAALIAEKGLSDKVTCNQVGCCLGTACYVKGAQQVVDKFSEQLGIKPGETTEDGMFTLDALRCIGACAIAPAVSINGKVYPKVAVSAVPTIIKELRAKEAV